MQTAPLFLRQHRVLGGVVFSLGLVLVIVAGAELFTGNNLLSMAWADGKITSGEVLRNWVIVCAANFVGAAGLALLVYWSGHAQMNNGLIAEQYVKIAAAKCLLPFWPAFFKSALCNILVCLAAGFEHSVADMYFIPLGMLLQDSVVNVVNADAIIWLGFAHNLVPVILGNLVGGSVLMGLVYHLIYRRGVNLKSS